MKSNLNRRPKSSIRSRRRPIYRVTSQWRGMSFEASAGQDRSAEEYLTPSEPDGKTRASLIRRVRDTEDSAAWTEFWELYEPLLNRYVRRLKVNREDARDIVHDIFIKLVRLLPGFRLDSGRGQFRGWLRRVTDNTVRDAFRAVNRRRRREAEFARYHHAVCKALADTAEGDAERDRLWARNTSALVMQQIRREFAHRPTTLACFEETILARRSAREVAADLGIANVSNVYGYASRVYRRVKELKRMYEGEGEEMQNDEL